MINRVLVKAGVLVAENSLMEEKYKVFCIRNLITGVTVKQEEKALAKLQAEGWELVSVDRAVTPFGSSWKVFYYLRRA